MDAILILFCFLAVTLFVLGIYFGINDFAKRQTKRRASTGGGALRNFESSGGPTSGTESTRTGDSPWRDRLRLWIEQSGLRVSLSALIGSSCLMGTVTAGLGSLFYSWWLVAPVSVITATFPFALIAILRNRRSDRLRAQLPDALDLMSRMLRAGQTITQSLRGVADEFDSPIADEFGYCYEQQNLGLSTDASMYEMARRTGVLELRILVVALTVHRQAGGNLSELLDNLANVIRDRYRIQGQIRALTADGRLQAAILLALPPLLLVVLSVINRDYVAILFQFPWLLVGMFGFELFGALWLHRIVSFDF